MTKLKSIIMAVFISMITLLLPACAQESTDDVISMPVPLTTYTITFDLDGGTMTTESVQVKAGNRIGELPTPKKEGFLFTYWKYNEIKVDEKTIYNFGEDIQLKAYYKTDEYTVKHQLWCYVGSQLVELRMTGSVAISEDSQRHEIPDVVMQIGDKYTSLSNPATLQIYPHNRYEFLYWGYKDEKGTLQQFDKNMAFTAENFGELKEIILKESGVVTGGGVTLNNRRQYESAKTALTHIERASDNVLSMPLELISSDLYDAYTALGRITGITGSDALANEIFKHFCVGK